MEESNKSCRFCREPVTPGAEFCSPAHAQAHKELRLSLCSELTSYMLVDAVPHAIYVGMPALLYLEAFGSHVLAAFGAVPFLVGSVLVSKGWRDVDIRLLLPDERYASEGYGDPAHPHASKKWVATVLAWSALGKQMTGLPVDFQVQQRSAANRDYPGTRSAIAVSSPYSEG